MEFSRNLEAGSESFCIGVENIRGSTTRTETIYLVTVINQLIVKLLICCKLIRYLTNIFLNFDFSFLTVFWKTEEIF